ncbi:hypothetical protein [Bacillus sp. JJ783]|uniref:hypothetical protein n=1 Tax=Bacillus sp. JJ783 TaxID=3122974 RepID=UPI00300282F8
MIEQASIGELINELAELDEYDVLAENDLKDLLWRVITSAGITSNIINEIAEQVKIKRPRLTDWLGNKTSMEHKELKKIVDYLEGVINR